MWSYRKSFLVYYILCMLIIAASRLAGGKPVYFGWVDVFTLPVMGVVYETIRWRINTHCVEPIRLTS